MLDTDRTEPTERREWSPPRLVRLDRALTDATETGTRPGATEGATALGMYYVIVYSS